ncbi:CrcB-like protein-domain-containing protein [Zychaea mexicana]|uniref:CrcB-like protein-domain-containing protein n=1 Tax=Zychaea mexicana TaxID=64656 RepID=UPI0022FEAC9C|nr:CrcB-like protein-domain-containing protein [Zychaea mexicana]KAI9489391.1 CrcB-like protein-domain-containing protein [Zychaea mexicana]
MAELPNVHCHKVIGSAPPKKATTDQEQNQDQQSIKSTSEKDTQPTFELAEGERPVPEDHYALAELPDLQRPVVEVDQDQGKTKKVVRLKENKIVIAFIIIPMAILGTLIRIGLQRLQTYDGQPVFGLVYAQWIGCFVMGIAVQQKDLLMQWYLPLQVGLSTGLCGSITTFSSWQLDIFKAFSNYDAANHYTGYNILAAISQLLVTLAMSLNGLVFGYHVGQFLSRVPIQHQALSEIISNGFSVHHLDRHDAIVIVVGTASWIGVIIAAALTTHNNQRELAMACVFAPVGALLRWHLSVLNAKFLKGRFFFGTFAANLIGTLALAILTLLESGVVMSTVACDVIRGLADGFCGCLTTISTFVVELSNLPLKYTYIYGMTSIILSQCFMFLVCGTFIWTQGVNPTC